MNTRLITEQHLRAWLKDILESGRCVIAPQRESSDGAGVLYREIQSADDFHIYSEKPRYSLKQFLFPITEPVFRYRHENGTLVVEDVEPDIAGVQDKRDIVIFGAPPCDAASLLRLDAVFLADPPDPFYSERRKRITVIGLSCRHPQPECFCTAVGLSPTATAGSDILITPLNMPLCDGYDVGPAYLMEVKSKAGRALAKTVEGVWIDPGKPEDEEWLLRLKKHLDKQLCEQLAPRRALDPKSTDMKKSFDSPDWEDVARTCLGCGVCAFVCPTCHCFDLTDEGTLKHGERCKNWDSCSFANFTLHASGHNPRPTQMERYRQRVMHKFSYFTEKTKMVMCVGCGRCTKYCPVGISIYDVRARWQ